MTAPCVIGARRAVGRKRAAEIGHRETRHLLRHTHFHRRLVERIHRLAEILEKAVLLCQLAFVSVEAIDGDEENLA